MGKIELSIYSLLLCGSIVIVPGVGNTRPEEPHTTWAAAGSGAVIFAPQGGEAVEATAGSTEWPEVGQKISEEERERRVQVCERQLAACRKTCRESKQGPSCYAGCSEKLGQCMKKIPYAE
jgi:hypothetical protein